MTIKMFVDATISLIEAIVICKLIYWLLLSMQSCQDMAAEYEGENNDSERISEECSVVGNQTEAEKERAGDDANNGSRVRISSDRFCKSMYQSESRCTGEQSD